MKITNAFTNEKGVAMVLAISMIGLLSSLGIWIVMQSQAGFKTTSSLERRQAVFNLSEGSLNLAYRCIREEPPAPTYRQLVGTSPVQREYASSDLPSYVTSPTQPVTRGSIAPRILYVDYTTTPPPGWMLNKQGYLNYYGLFHKPMGDARIPLPDSQGDSRSVVSSLTERVMR